MSRAASAITWFAALALLAGCAPTPTVTPPATPTATPSTVAETATPRPTHTRNPSMTPRPSITPTPTATDAPEPVSIGLAPDDAGRAVLAWLDPTRAPRIEWAKVMRRSVLLAAWAPGEVPEVLPDASGYTSVANFYVTSSLPEIVIVVEASTESVGSEVLPWFAGADDPIPDGCRPAGEGIREHLVAIFDAESGQPLVAGLIHGQSWRPLADALRSLPPLRSTVHASPTPTPTPTRDRPAQATRTPPPRPTDPPDHQRLTPANMPESLKRIFDMYPLQPGSSWTWRITDRNSGVRWTVSTVTETVEAVWLMPDDLALVKVNIESRPITHAGDESGGEALAHSVIYREVSQHGVSVGRFNDHNYGRLLPESERIALEPLTDHFRPGSASGVIRDSAAEDVTVTTRAGTFRGCTRFGVLGGAGWSVYRWFCPGVGYVRDEHYGCYTNAAHFKLNELVRWQVPGW